LEHLTARREELRSDVDTLDRFESDYRDRLVRAIEADLAVVKGRGTAAPSAVPDLVSVATDTDMPPAPPMIGSAAPSRSESTIAAASSPPATTDIIEAVSIDDDADTPSEASRETREPVPATVGSAELFAAEARSDRQLPDDAFFTSLREAVRDDAPLEPGEERFFEEHAKDGPTIRDVFRRKR
jgi:hypothetical protein